MRKIYIIYLYLFNVIIIMKRLDLKTMDTYDLSYCDDLNSLYQLLSQKLYKPIGQKFII